jgi:hypothetical protein
MFRCDPVCSGLPFCLDLTPFFRSFYFLLDLVEECLERDLFRLKPATAGNDCPQAA